MTLIVNVKFFIILCHLWLSSAKTQNIIFLDRPVSKKKFHFTFNSAVRSRTRENRCNKKFRSPITYYDIPIIGVCVYDDDDCHENACVGSYAKTRYRPWCVDRYNRTVGAGDGRRVRVLPGFLGVPAKPMHPDGTAAITVGRRRSKTQRDRSAHRGTAARDHFLGKFARKTSYTSISLSSTRAVPTRVHRHHVSLRSVDDKPPVSNTRPRSRMISISPSSLSTLRAGR